MSGAFSGEPRARARLFVALFPPAELALEIERAAASVIGSERDLRRVRREELHLTLHFAGEVAREKVVELGDALERELAGAPAPAVELGATGCFPERGRPRVWWIALSDPAGKPAARRSRRQRSPLMDSDDCVAGLEAVLDGATAPPAASSNPAPCPRSPREASAAGDSDGLLADLARRARRGCEAVLGSAGRGRSERWTAHLTLARTRAGARGPERRVEEAFRALEIHGSFVAREVLLVESHLERRDGRYEVLRRHALGAPARD